MHKGGDENDLNNFRDKTLLGNLGKLFDMVLNNRLKTWISERNILNNTQAGFRKDYSTHDNIFVLPGLITKSRIEKKKLLSSFVDFRKAFNSVYRNGLWYTLIGKCNCNGKLLRVIKDLYSKIKCSVYTETRLTDFFTTSQGVQQGAILSPLLYVLFLNDLCDILNDCDGVRVGECDIKVLKYADDIVLVSETANGLQNALDRLYDYCTEWKLNVNLAKTKLLVCRGGGLLGHSEHWFWGDRQIDIWSEIR